MRPNAFIGLREPNSSRAAFTRAEVIAILAGLFLCAAVLLPSFANSGSRSEQVSCLNNLRQIGIAFQAWGNEHDDRRPWMVSHEQGGTGGDFGSYGGGLGGRSPNDAYFHFTPLSNHISPTLLSDPAEIVRNKRLARSWSLSPHDGFLHAGFRDNALSYMLGVHTTISESANILTGDRSVFFNGYAACSYGFASVLMVDRTPSQYRGWTNGNHGATGNVLLNDGRVEYTSSQRLYPLLFRPTDQTFGEHFLAPSQ